MMQVLPKNIAHDYIRQLAEIRDQMIYDPKDILKIYPTSRANTRHHVTILKLIECLKYKKLNISRTKHATSMNRFWGG